MRCLPRITRACYSLQSAVERALSCSRSLSLIRETGDQWIAASREISLTVRWLWRVFLTRQSATATSLCRRFDQYVPCVVCRAPWRMSTVPNFLNFTSSLLMLFFVQPLSGNSVRNKLPSVVTFTFIQTLDKILTSLLNGAARQANATRNFRHSDDEY